MEKKNKEHHTHTKEQKTEEYMKIDCRMYEEKFPKVNDLVMCEIKEIIDEGAYVELLEYDRIKGMLFSSEISRKRVNLVKRLIKEGREEVLLVLRIDPQKGFFDLSKKSVKAEEIEEFKEKYQKSKTVHQIMKILSFKTQIPILELYEQFCWPLYKKHVHAFYAFKDALNDEEGVFSKVNIKPEVRKELMEILKVRMIPQPVKIRADFNLTCHYFEGIDAIKKALLEGEKLSTPEIPIKFKVIGSPLYECSVVTVSKNEGIKLMQKALKTVETWIEGKGGKFHLQTNPTVIGEINNNIKDQIKSAKEDIEEEDSEENHDEGIHADIDEEMN